MRILIVTQYFWPEQFRINDIVTHLLKNGFEVDVMTGFPSYPSRKLYDNFLNNPQLHNNFNGANVIRIPNFSRGNASPFRLFINYLSFVLSAMFIGSFKIRKKNYDIIFTFATSPITVALPAVLFSITKNSKHIIWILDIWPDILYELKIIKKNLVYFFLRGIVNFIYKKTDIILVQSTGFKELIGKVVGYKKVFYLPSWSEDLHNDYKNNIPLEFSKGKNKFNIVFTGNIGEAQNFENIIKAAEITKDDKDLQWIIVGTGRKIKDYRKVVKEKSIYNFFFTEHKSIDQVKLFHNLASVLLISLSEGEALSNTIPGKFQSYLKANKFILGFISGITAELIKESKSGVVVHPSKYRALARTIKYLKNNPKKIQEVSLKKYGKKYLEKNFNKKVLLSNLLSFFKKDKNQINLIATSQKIPFNKNFSLSGMNLAFIGYLIKKNIKINENTYLWPDGIFFKRFFKNKNLKKVPGRELFMDLKIPFYIKKIYIIGNLNNLSKKIIENKFKKKTFHIALPVDTADNLFKNYLSKIKFKKIN